MSTAGPLEHLLGLGDLTPDELARLDAVHGVRDENDLAAACRTNRLRDDDAFGLERQVAIRRALTTTPWHVKRRHLADARAVAARLLSSLQNHESAVRLAPVGGIRRMEPWVDRVELLASAHEPENLVQAFTGLAPIERVLEQTEEGAVAQLADGTYVTLTVLAEDPGPYVTTLIERTGPEAHVAVLKERARARGMTLDERGLLDANGPMPLAWEPDVYTALELEPIPPELRHVEPISEPPKDLVHMRDIRGLAHVHTDAGRGSAPLEGYARAALQNGFAWLLVADRDASTDVLSSQRSVQPTSDDPEVPPARLFVGLETRVNEDGRVEADAEAFGAAAVVIGVAGDTAAALAAARNERVRVLAHPRTEALDWDTVLPALAETDTALEISGESRRAELSPALLRQALDLGVKLMPAADAHDLGSIDRAIVAVGQARRAGARVSEVLPTLSADEFARWARR